MLKDSQHIGHSSPSPLPFEHTSSSENSKLARFASLELFFSPMEVRAFDANLHIILDQK
jgi:hypothetical protein